MSAASEILLRIEDDPVFRGFLESGFDPAAFASTIVKADVGNAAIAAAASAAPGAGPVAAVSLKGDGVGASDHRSVVTSAESVSSQAEVTLDSMSSHIARIEAAIRAHILDNEEDFLGSVGGVSELSRRTEEFRNGVRELRRSFMRVRREVSEPHEAVRLRTQQLKNLHAATRLLKRALRFLAALRRLKGQEEALGLGASGGGGGRTGGVADLRELAKAAQSLQELEGTLRDPEVSDLEVIARERPYVEACGATVRRMSADSLARGLKALNQTDVGGALQVFFNLGCLPARVKACVTHLADEADAAAAGALQPTALTEATSAGLSSSSTTEPTSPKPGVSVTSGGSSIGGGGRAPSAREAGAAAARRRAARMRAHAGKLATLLHGTSMEAWGLQRVLDKKRDPTTRALLDATVRGDRAARLSAGAYSAYWDGLCLAVRGAVERALSSEGIGISDGGGGGGGVALVAMYPFFRKAFLHLIRRLEDGKRGPTQGSSRGVGGVSSSMAGGSGDDPKMDPAGRAGSVPSWSRALISAGSGGFSGGSQSGTAAGGVGGGGGVLGGSAWLSLALDDEEDYSSLGGTQGGGNRRRVGEAAAEARVGPSEADDSRRGHGLRRRDGQGDGEGPSVGGGGGKSSDCARLLAALGPLRDLFLARSLERLTTPVEQMFPQYDGYMAAVPSKHDLASLVRSIRAEIALAVPIGSASAVGGPSEVEAIGGRGTTSGGGTEADLSLAPLLLKGVVTAMKLLCQKVEAMHSVEEAAYTFGGGSGKGGSGGLEDGRGGGTGTLTGGNASSPASLEAWAPTPQQEHNLQLLELVVKLREALLGIPAMITPQDGKGTGSGGADSAKILAECRDQVADAVEALDESASDVILEPYLSGVSDALETIVAKMHRENFGRGAGASMASDEPGGGGSLFLMELQGALAALQADHFGRIAALRIPCVQESLRSLAARILRAYVTHCALLRPLSEEGKSRVAHDMATLEIALSPLARVSELGSVYEESRAFRTLLFVDDGEEGGLDSRSFLTEACMAHLRPSSVWHYLFSRAPDELSSPHVARGLSELAYVRWLLGGGAAAEARAREEDAAAEPGAGGGSGSTVAGVTNQGRSTLSPDMSYMAEVGAWTVVQGCLDAYHQRRSATTGVNLTSAVASPELPRAVSQLPEAGPALLSAYEARVNSGGGGGVAIAGGIRK